MGRREINIGFWLEYVKVNEQWEDLGIDEY
jgi:hypothetical protein